MASGLTLIFGVMRIINIAQGAFLILVATFTWWLWRETGIDPILASVITTPLMFGLGWLLYRRWSPASAGSRRRCRCC